MNKAIQTIKAYLRTGHVERRDRTDPDNDGGYLIPPDFVTEMQMWRRVHPISDRVCFERRYRPVLEFRYIYSSVNMDVQ